ncbi:MAG: signal peptidase II, partial [Caldimonas sp.]
MAGKRSASIWPWLGIALAVIVLDQLTKTLITGAMRLSDVRTITPFFDIVRAHNTGAAFSFLAGAAG